LRDESPDPYAALREAYLQNRQAEIDILRGKKGGADAPSAPADEKTK
jgi:ABC-type transporter lipoprotein component MlaA